MWAYVGSMLLIFDIYINLTPKKDGILIKYIIPSVSIAVISVGMYIDPRNSLINNIGSIMIFFYAILCFKDKISKKIFIFAITYIIALFCDTVMAYANYLISGKIIDPTIASYKTLIVITIYDIVLFLTFCIFSYYYSKKEKKILSKSLLLFFLVPLSQFLIFYSISRNAYKSHDIFFEYVNFRVLSLGSVVAVIADILLFIALMENSKAKRNLMKLAQLEYNAKLSQNYYENIVKNAEQLMKYKHDINNMLTAATNLINSEDEHNRVDGLNMLEELKQKNQKTTIPFYCENPIVNAVLYDKEAYANENDVDFNFEVKIPQHLPISLTDLCSIFTNLIDNAVNNAAKSKNKSAELKAWCDMGFLFVKTKNFLNDADNEVKKSDFDINNIKSHGYGLDILEDISKKYDGKLEYSQNGNIFETFCCVQISNE